MPAPYEMTRYFEVNRVDLRRTRWTDEAVPTVDSLGPNQIAVRVDRFALTANNVTYGLLGEQLGYWAFFPTEAGWGRIPAWGLGDVVASRHPEVRPGERLFGYVPMGSDVVLQPGRLSPAALADASPHRARLNPTYNHYLRLAGHPAYDRTWDSHLALLRPLVMTALVIDAFLTDESAFGARRIALASASSKTAVATAFLLSRDRPGRPEVIGLTSPAHADFCRRLTFYDRVFTYDDVAAVPTGVPTVLLDMSGNAAVRAALHGHLRNDLTYSGQVGWTHWDQGQTAEPLPGVAPMFFSSLEHIRRRSKEWGAAEFETRFDAAWQAFLPVIQDWLRIVHGRGRAAVEQAYEALLNGRARPEVGHILSV
jgi:hypothetical protein